MNSRLRPPTAAISTMTMRTVQLLLMTLLPAACLTTQSTYAAMISATPSTDNVLQGNFESGASNVYLENNSNARRIGTGGGSSDTRTNQPILGFSLPAIPAGEQIVSAVFSVTMDTPALTGDAGAPVFDVVVSLMGGTTFSGSDFVEVPGPNDLGAGNAFVGSFTATDVGDATVESFTLSGSALSQLAGLYDLSGSPSQTDVFFRLSNSETIDISSNQNNQERYNLGRSGDPFLVTRTLTIETARIPEPASMSLLTLATAGLLLRSRKQTA